MKKIPFQKIIDTEWLESHGIVDYGVVFEDTPDTLTHFNSWLSRGDHGVLSYMGDHRAQLRQSLKNFFPKYESAIVFLFSYEKMANFLESFYQKEASNGLKIASYAMGFEGLDYHLVILNLLNQMKDKIIQYDENIEITHSLDIQPVLERDLAYKAGLGWFGKNSMLISRKHGSFFLIGSLLLSAPVDLMVKERDTDHCGNCRACLDACPTNAIREDERAIISNKCISTFSIEIFKEAAPPLGMIEKGRGEVFGCDICQVVCPWNRKNIDDVGLLSDSLTEQQKLILNFFLERSLEQIVFDLENMSNKKFKRVFKGTALERTGRVGLLKNINAYHLLGNSNSK